MSNETKEKHRAITGVSRLNYVHLWEPRVNPDKPDEEPMYQAVVMIPKTDVKAVAEIKEAIAYALKVGIAETFKGIEPAPGTIRNPLRDGDIDRAGKPEFAGHWFINVKSKFQPGIVDRARKTILDREQIYSGVYCIVSLNFRAFDKKGNKGISAQINNVMKVKDGPKLSGGLSAADEFAGIVITEDEADAGAAEAAWM